MNIKCHWAALFLPLALLSCSSNGGSDESELQQPELPAENCQEIKISTSVSAISRATDTGFETNDCIGLYVVNQTGDARLRPSGNHVDNMRFTYSGVWTPDTPIYWSDDKTSADFYLYYPYRPDISDVTAVDVSVQSDQSTLTRYKESEILAGSTRNVAPTASAVKISAQHLMSQMVVAVAAGNGFTEESLKAAQVGVTINGVQTAALLNIAEQKLTAKGPSGSIKPLLSDGLYKALVVPQTVEEGNLITVNVDGRDFNLKKGFTFVAGKSHKFTVTVSKTSNGINVGISGWETDDVDHGGVAE